MFASVLAIPLWVGILLIIFGAVAALMAHKQSSRVLGLIAVAVGAVSFFQRPVEPKHDLVSSEGTVDLSASGLSEFKTPMWSKDDIDNLNGTARYMHERSERPLYYAGPMPLKYLEFQIPSAGVGDVAFTKSQDFGDFQNIITKWDGLSDFFGPARGAVTVSPSGQVLAEGRLLQRTGRTAVIEEYHYNTNGSLIFRSESLIDDHGVKKLESHTAGKKQRDYYFLWPGSY